MTISKRVIAREWLIVLALIVLSPAVMAIYLWVTPPSTIGDVFDDDRGGPSRFTFKEVTSSAVDTPRTEAEPIKSARRPTVKKKGFGNYFLDYMKEPTEWFGWGAWWPFIVLYPCYWFVRSVVWSMRTLKST